MKKILFLVLTAIAIIACSPIEPDRPTQGGGNNNNNNSNNGTSTQKPKDAIASFSYDPIKAYAGQKVTFINESSNAYFYEWDFGNGRTSKEKNPTMVFESGTWTVTLTAWNKDKSQRDKIQKTINVREKPKTVQLTHFIINSVDYEDSDGKYWDGKSTDGPDVFFVILDSNNKEILNSKSKYISDVTPDKLPHTFTISNTILNLSRTYKIILKDYEEALLDPNDVMWTYIFKPSEHLIEYQESITINSKEGLNGRFSITLKFKFD